VVATQHLDGQRMHLTFRVTPRAEGLKPSFASIVQ
jgi:hypothetical protein